MLSCILRYRPRICPEHLRNKWKICKDIYPLYRNWNPGYSETFDSVQDFIVMVSRSTVKVERHSCVSSYLCHLPCIRGQMGLHHYTVRVHLLVYVCACVYVWEYLCVRACLCMCVRQCVCLCFHFISRIRWQFCNIVLTYTPFHQTCIQQDTHSLITNMLIIWPLLEVSVLLTVSTNGKGKGKVHPITGHEGPEVE